MDRVDLIAWALTVAVCGWAAHGCYRSLRAALSGPGRRRDEGIREMYALAA